MRIFERKERDIKNVSNILHLRIEMFYDDIDKIKHDDLYREYIFKKYMRESEESFKIFIKDIIKE